MKRLKNKILKACYKTKLGVKKNAPTILTCLSVVGVVATAVLSVKASSKAQRLIKEATDEKGEALSKSEITLLIVPSYIPPVITGISTIACILGANVLNKNQQASLTSAYALLNDSYKRYRNKVKEIYGNDADVEIRAAIARDIYSAEPPELHAYGFGCLNGLEEVVDNQGDIVLFYEEYSHQYFESTVMAVQAAEYRLNRNFSLRGCADLNEFYEFLGLPSEWYGSTVGWSMSYGYSWVDFNHQKVVLDDGLECYILAYEFSPEADFEDC